MHTFKALKIWFISSLRGLCWNGYFKISSIISNFHSWCLQTQTHIYDYDIYTEVIIAFWQLELHMTCLSNTWILWHAFDVRLEKKRAKRRLHQWKQNFSLCFKCLWIISKILLSSLMWRNDGICNLVKLQIYMGIQKASPLRPTFCCSRSTMA